MGACASLTATIVLMMISPMLALVFFLLVIYSVVPFSLWKKSTSRRWRLPVLLSGILGYGLILAAFIIECTGVESIAQWQAAPFGFLTLIAAFLAGVVFLPLAAIGSLTTLRARVRDSRPPTNESPEE